MPQVTLIRAGNQQIAPRLRVCAYCRVSTDSKDQLNSYARQIQVYTDTIRRHSDWEMVEIFADEGISGKSANNRPQFQRMIRLCEQKQIDLILTKSISRFARNTKETLEYVRKLKLLGIGVQFEKEGINTLSLGDEMLLSTFASIAQEESVSISQNVRFGIRKRMEAGEYVNGCSPYGYQVIDNKLAVYEPEAVIVRHIFNLYLNGYGEFQQIAQELEQLNRRLKAIQESHTANDDYERKVQFLSEAIERKKHHLNEYDDTLVRQMIECVKIHSDGKAEIIFGGGYTMEEQIN